jgi:tetratricopeptide (TPR) repeat protein
MALLAIQQSRAEASAEAQTNVAALTQRLHSLEQELAEQRAQNNSSAQSSNRLLIAAAAGVFLIGISAMVLMAWFQARGMHRLAEIATNLGSARPFPQGPDPLGQLALGPTPTDPRLLLPSTSPSLHSLSLPGPTPADSQRLQATLQRLEQRLREVEITAQGPSSDPDSRRSQPEADKGPQAVAIAKFQTLLKLGQPDAALKVAEESLRSEPSHAGWLLRQGLALEQLQRFSEALDALDRAIEIAPDQTQAFLAKGSVLNRQQRYQEALACYEAALDRRPSSPSSPA